jgi:hypothetical protein
MVFKKDRREAGDEDSEFIFKVTIDARIVDSGLQEGN